jgi:hypothetical protein
MKRRLSSVPAVAWIVLLALAATVVLAWVPAGAASATAQGDSHQRMQLLRLHPH